MEKEKLIARCSLLGNARSYLSAAERCFEDAGSKELAIACRQFVEKAEAAMVSPQKALKEIYAEEKEKRKQEIAEAKERAEAEKVAKAARA